MKPEFMKRAKRAKRATSAQTAFKGMEQLPTYAIVSTIDAMIGILRRRGVTVTDWDDHTKDIHGMKFLGSTAFILAPQTRDTSHDGTRGTSHEEE